MSTGDSPPWAKLLQYWGRGGLLLACLLVRLVALDADPPSWLSWSTGLYTDEGFYTLDARHEVLFGTLAPGDFHDRLLSPLLSVLQQGVFSLFGTGLIQARLLSVAFGLLTVGLFWMGLRRVWGEKAADLGALFLGLAPPFALYNRLALQETPTVFWLVLAFTFWVYGARRPALYVLSGLSFAAAMVFKGLALMAGLALLSGEPTPQQVASPRETGRVGVSDKVANGADLNSSSSRFGRTPSAAGRWVLSGFLLGFALYAAFWYLPHQAELSRMATYYRVHQMQPHSWHILALNVQRAFDGGERGVFPYLLAMLPVPLALAGWRLWNWKRWSAVDRFLALWLTGGLGFCLVSSYAPSRYYVLFLPALVGLAAHSLSQMRRPVKIAIVIVFLLTSLAWYGAAWNGRSEARRDTSRNLSRMLPLGSVVIGDFAPALCLGTSFAATTVQPGLANDDHPVERLKATHVVLVQNAPYWPDWWRMRYPDIVQPSHRIATFDLDGSRHYVVDVYAVKRPL